MLSPGVVLNDRYLLNERIAAGGMGEVWRGVDRLLRREVAVKVLLPTLMSDNEFITRFRTEARMLAGLRHAGIVQVYDYGENAQVDGARLDYLVMEFIEGVSLSKHISDAGRLSVAETMGIVAQAAEALQVAHDAGIVHRDVKPSNLLVRPGGAVVLVDFGVARSTTATGLTGTNVVLGSAHYMAPEQAEGRPISARTDIYAVGAVAYCCLAGRPPFVGENPLQVLGQLVYTEPPALPQDVPPPVASLVMRCLSKDPGRRFPSGSALAQAARQAANGGGFATGPTAPMGPRPGTFPGPARTAAMGVNGGTGRTAPVSPGRFDGGTGRFDGGTGRFDGGTGRAAPVGPGGFNSGAASVGGYHSGAASVGAPRPGYSPSGGFPATPGPEIAAYETPSSNYAARKRRNATVAALVAAVVVGVAGIALAFHYNGDKPAEGAPIGNPGGAQVVGDPGGGRKDGKPGNSAETSRTKNSSKTKEATQAPTTEPTTDAPTVAATNPYGPRQICGALFKIVTQQQLQAGDGTELGTIYLLYNDTTEANCVVTIKASDLDSKTAASAYLQVQGDDADIKSDSVQYYVGPVKKKTDGECVKWGGSIGDVPFDSGGFSDCGDS